MQFKTSNNRGAVAVMRFAKNRPVVAIIFALLCCYLVLTKLFASSSMKSSSSLLCDDDGVGDSVIKDAYAYSIGTNPVLSRENPMFSSFICFGGEDMECWNVDKEFKPYDYTVRYCLFKNVLWDRDGSVVFYQDVNNVPLWDFDHGQTRFQFNAEEYQRAYGVKIRLVNSSLPLPSSNIQTHEVNTVVFAHEHVEPEQQHLSVWSAFQAMASTAMLSLENEIVVSSKHAILSRYWPTLSRKITRKEDFTAQVLLTHLVLTPINGQALLPHEELARVFQTRALFLNNVPKPAAAGKRRGRMRIGVQMQAGYDLQPVIDQLKQRYSGMDLILLHDDEEEFTSLREEIAVFSRLDFYILLFPGHNRLSLAFLSEGSTAVLGNTCKGSEGENKPCSLYAKRWSMFPHFAKIHLSITGNGNVVIPESILL